MTLRRYDWGVATFASRAAVVSGNAIHKTAMVVREKTLKAAANMIEVDVADIELARRRGLGEGFKPLRAARRRRDGDQPAALCLQ